MPSKEKSRNARIPVFDEIKTIILVEKNRKKVNR